MCVIHLHSRITIKVEHSNWTHWSYANIILSSPRHYFAALVPCSHSWFSSLKCPFPYTYMYESAPLHQGFSNIRPSMRHFLLTFKKNQHSQLFYSIHIC